MRTARDHGRIARLIAPVGLLTALTVLGVAGLPTAQLGGAAQAAAAPAAFQPDAADSWRSSLWETAVRGDKAAALDLLTDVPDRIDPAGTADLRAAIDLLTANIASRETARQEQISEHRERFAEELERAASGEPADLSDALSTALFLEQLVEDADAFHAEPEIIKLINDAERAARRAEAAQQWLAAAELFARLDLLTEASQRFKDDVERQALRREQLTLYAPEAYWGLRDTRLRELEQRGLERWHREFADNPEDFEDDAEPPTVDGLPPFNARGEDYTEKLDGITRRMALSAINAAAGRHINATSTRAMVIGGLDVIAMLIDTREMRSIFPSLENDRDVTDFRRFLDEERDKLQAARRDLSNMDLARTLDRVMATNRQTIALPDEVVIHEFGAGAMNELDQFSEIIWPHELRRFYKRLGSSFIGVGIHINNDPITGDLRVHTPISGMPAMRAGVRAGDVITHVDGEPTVGITADQAVDVITGPKGTDVTLTIKRVGDDGEEIIKNLTIVRAEIDIPTVTGWRRLRPDNRVDAWDWFIDRDQRIGYLRLEKFAEESTRELDAAVAAMKDDGLEALILDLRHNSGGQFDQAINIANRFIPRGTLVSTVNNRTAPPESHAARASQATLADIPVAILVNGNSASASEIVAGAVKAHARENNANAIVIGERSYGKGTVQNVHGIERNTAAMKVTTQFYQLPDGSLIHRRPGSSDWGVSPNLRVDLLPSQITDSIIIRRDADVIPIDENGMEVVDEDRERRDPQVLIDEGIDLQLNTALVLLKTQVPTATSGTAMLDEQPRKDG